MNLPAILTWLLFMVLPVAAQDTTAKQNDFDRAIHAAVEGVGSLVKTLQGSRGAPIALFGEVHNSRALQLQMAIALVRLHDSCGMHEVALEGYLTDSERVSAAWYHQASRGDLLARARAGTELLREGEISAPEFAALVFADYELDPVDKGANYVADPENVFLGARLYLLRIGETKASEEAKRIYSEIDRLIAEYNSKVQNWSEPEKVKQKEEINTQMGKYRDAVLGWDPWLKETYDITTGRWWETQNLGQVVALLHAIERRAVEAKAQLTDGDKKRMQEGLAWWEARHRASSGMAEEASASIDRSDRPVAMIVGDAHTDDVLSALGSQGRHVVVLAMKDASPDIPMEMYRRKMDKKSIYSEGLTRALVDAFASNRKKPQPVLNEPWFQAKAEVYLLSDRLVHGIFGAASNEGGLPPFGLDKEQFVGSRVTLDIERARIVPLNPPPGKKTYKITELTLVRCKTAAVPEVVLSGVASLRGATYIGDEEFLRAVRASVGRPVAREHENLLVKYSEVRAVLFPVILRQADPTVHREVWIKAALLSEEVSGDEREAVERMLFEAFDAVKSEQAPLKEAPTDGNGRVQLSTEVMATFGGSAGEAENMALGTI